MSDAAPFDGPARGGSWKLRGLLLAMVVVVTALTLWRWIATTRLPESVVAGGPPTHVRLVPGRIPGSFELLWTTAEERPDQKVWLKSSPDGPGFVVEGVEQKPFPDPAGSGLVAWRSRVVFPPDDPDSWWFEGEDDHWLEIVWGAVQSRAYRFRTFPSLGEPVTLLAGGDSLDELGPRRRMNDFIREQVEADPAILAFLHGGDFVRHGERLDEWLDWLEDWDRTTTTDGRLLPIVPARGNHEATGPLFDFVFGRPGTTAGAWYERSIGPSLSVVTLDSNRPVQGEQLDWLRATLEASRARRWTIVQYHFELWPAIRPRQERAPDWIQAFEEFGVDLAIECNGHCVKRTVPILRGERDPEGLVYIGEGGLGAKQRTPEPERWWLQAPGFAANAAHVWKLRFAAESVDLEVLSPDSGLESTAARGSAPRRP